jgi:hypothetical protein
MGRLLLIALASLMALTASPAIAEAPVRSTSDQPYQRSPELQEYLDSLDAMEAAAEAANEEARIADEALRREKAADIRAHDAQVDAWREAHPAPEGTRDTLVHDRYDDAYNPESTELIYINKYQIPTHTVELGPDGQATGPVTQTQQGKAWETIGPKVSPGQPPGLLFGEDENGERTITEAEIPGPDGRHIIAKYEFNEDGVPWRGETFDPETGQRTGGFQDDRLKPKEPTLGGPLDVPPTVRLITGVCEKCRPLVNRHNDLANEINTRIVEMQSLSREHQHAYPRAQGPIRMRYDVLKGQLDALTPQFEALRAEVLACDKTCREPQAQLPDGVVRPALATVALDVPASFCSQTARVEFLNAVYNPAAATALANSQAAQAYATRLNGLFTEYMRNEGGPIWAAIQKEMADYKPIAEGAFAESNRINGLYETIMAVPIADCPQLAENTEVPSTGQPLTPVRDTPSKPGKPDCPPEERRKPIKVGPNSKVGSGARLKAKAASTALGIAGGLLGSAAGLPGGGGGGGSGGPPTVVCKIKDGEMTVFNDPATGVSLKVGAKRAGGTVVVFADIARSPDNGTFQTAFLENPQGEAMAPADVGICDLWGEWKLTVSWTKSTYVDGQLVSQESGGWAKAGRFVIPGTLSTVDKPDGLWKRLGFSNASHGARKIAMQYKLPTGGGPVDLIVHVTRPGEDPVTTVPFALTMVEGPNGGFTFTKAPEKDCPPTLVNVSNTPQTTTPPASNPPPVQITQPPATGGTTTRTEQKVENLAALENWIDEEKADDLEWRDELDVLRRCEDLVAWGSWNSKRDTWLRRLRERLEALNGVVPTGPLADGVREAVSAERTRTEVLIKEIEAMKWDCPMPPPPPPQEPSVIDEIDHVPVIS